MQVLNCIYNRGFLLIIYVYVNSRFMDPVLVARYILWCALKIINLVLRISGMVAGGHHGKPPLAPEVMEA